MDAKEYVSSPEEWLNLTELSLPTLINDKDKGTIYQVFKAGFVFASPDDCAKQGIKPQRKEGGKYVLPTIVVEIDGQRQLCRLPFGLSSWAFDSVALAQSGMNPFPSQVEFGTLKGRTFAEIL